MCALTSIHPTTLFVTPYLKLLQTNPPLPYTDNGDLWQLQIEMRDIRIHNVSPSAKIVAIYGLIRNNSCTQPLDAHSSTMPPSSAHAHYDYTITWHAIRGSVRLGSCLDFPICSHDTTSTLFPPICQVLYNDYNYVHFPVQVTIP